jgi:hypothetical protein
MVSHCGNDCNVVIPVCKPDVAFFKCMHSCCIYDD